MKYGIRTPSIKKRIAARTSVKRAIRHRAGLKAPRGSGFITNPKKATYNRVYNRTTAGCMTLPLFLIFLGVLAASVSFAAPQQHKKASPSASGVAGLMHASRASVEHYLGKPVSSDEDRVDNKGIFYNYVKGGNKWMVEFYGDKASSFDITLSRHYGSPQAALSAIGLSMGGKRPTESGNTECLWKGHLFPSGIRRVHVGNFGDGWAAIEITDKEDE